MSTASVLLVDSDPSCRKLVEVSLRKEGYEVGAAASAELALAAAGGAPPDVLVAAHDLPGADGFDLVRRLRDLPGWRRLPVVMLVRQHSVEILSRGLEAGVEDFLQKPVFVRELIARVGLVVEREAQRGALDVSEGGPVSGSLMGMALADVLTNLANQRATGVLYVEEGERRGRVWIRDGVVANARVGELEGREALFRAFRWDGGTFTFDPRPVEQADRIRASVEELNAAAVDRLDEWDRAWERLPAGDPTLEADLAKAATEARSLPREVRTILRLCDGVRPVSRVVDDSPFDDLETLGVVARLLDKGFVEPAEEAPDPAAVAAEASSSLRAWAEGRPTAPEPAEEETWDIDERLQTMPIPTAPDEPPAPATPEEDGPPQSGLTLETLPTAGDTLGADQPATPQSLPDGFAEELRQAEETARARAAEILQEAEAARAAAEQARREAEEARRRAEEEAQERRRQAEAAAEQAAAERAAAERAADEQAADEPTAVEVPALSPAAPEAAEPTPEGPRTLPNAPAMEEMVTAAMEPLPAVSRTPPPEPPPPAAPLPEPAVAPPPEPASLPEPPPSLTVPPVEPEAPPPPLPAAEPVPETPPEPEPLPMPPAEPDLSPLPMPPPEPDLSPLPAPPTEQEQERAPTTPVGEGAASLPAIETEPWQIEESLPSDPLAAPVNEGATEDPPMATEAEAEAILGSLAELSTRSLQEEGGVSGAEEAAPPPPSPLPERQDTGQDPSTAPWLPADPLAEGEGLSEPAALTGPDVGPEGEKSFVDTWSSMRAVSDSPDVTPPPMDDETVQAPPVPVEVPLPPPVFEEDVPQPTAQTESGQDDPRTWPSMADIRQRRASMASMEASGELPSKRKRPSMADLDEPASEGYPKGFYWAIGLVLLLLAGGGVGLWWIRTHSPPEPLPDGGKVAAVAPRADHRDYPVEAGSLGEPYRPTRPVPPAPEEGPAPEPEEEPAPEPEEEPAEDEGGEEKEPAEAAPKPKAAAPKGGGGKGHVALFKKGESLRNKGRLGDAVKAYKQALAIKPGHVASLLGLGNAYFDLGRSGDAVGVLKKAVTAGPKNAEAHLVLGMVYQEQNKAGAAAKAYKKFLKLAPRHPHAGEVQVVLDGLGK